MKIYVSDENIETSFRCDVCGREVNGITIVNGMRFCAKCYQETFAIPKALSVQDLENCVKIECTQCKEKDQRIAELEKENGYVIFADGCNKNGKEINKQVYVTYKEKCEQLKAELEKLRTEVERLKKENEELKEYYALYEELLNNKGTEADNIELKNDIENLKHKNFGWLRIQNLEKEVEQLQAKLEIWNRFNKEDYIHKGEKATERDYYYYTNGASSVLENEVEQLKANQNKIAIEKLEELKVLLNILFNIKSINPEHYYDFEETKLYGFKQTLNTILTELKGDK